VVGFVVPYFDSISIANYKAWICHFSDSQGSGNHIGHSGFSKFKEGQVKFTVA